MFPSSIWQRKLDPSKGEIRLFELEPSDDINSIPKGRLLVGSIRRFSDFDAISHAWGFPQPSVLISLGDSDTYWPVTESLCTAFRYLRDPVKHRRFWVDALCIDPFNVEERGQQIPFLQDIFNNADTVHVWIRSGSPAVLDATRALKQLASIGSSEGGVDPSTVDVIKKVTPFFEDEWWHRLWVKQEVALARKVLFHSRDLVVTLDEINRAKGILSSFLLSLSTLSITCAQKVVPINVEELAWCLNCSARIQLLRGLRPAELPERRQRIIGFVQMLQVLRRARVTDPRDRVYALLGICARLFDEYMNDVTLMQANYNDDIVQVFTIFACKLIEVSGSLYIFNQVSPIYNSIRTLPSWVPDWTSCFEYDSRLLVQHTWFHADHLLSQTRIPARPSFAKPLPPTFSYMLGLQGYIIGYVESVSGIIYSSGTSPTIHLTDLSRTIEQWREDYLCKQAQEIKDQGIPSERGDLRPFASVMFGTCKDTHLRETRSRQEVENVIMIIEDPSAVKSADTTRVHNTIKNSRFLTCKIGNDAVCPGTGPPDTLPGDKIAILNGGDTVYVLRPIANDEERDLFSFVGECFVYGAMEGQKVPPREPTTIWLK